MSKTHLLIGALAACILFSCENETYEKQEIPNEKSRVINHSARNDGMEYSLKNVTISNELTVLNTENSEILTYEDGTYRIKFLTFEASENIAENNILFLQWEDEACIRRIKSIRIEGDNIYKLETGEAYVGDLFLSGTLELSVDLDEAEKVTRMKKRRDYVLRDSGEAPSADGINFSHEYKFGELTFNPNSHLKSRINMSVKFGALRILPSEIVFTYEVQNAFNPYLKTGSALNYEYSVDLMKYSPIDIVDLFKDFEFETEMEVPILGLTPVKISLSEIQIPTYISASVGKATNIGYNMNSNFKAGFAYYSPETGKKSHSIYENNVTSGDMAGLQIDGEVIAEMKLVIIPHVTLLSASFLKVTGDITFGFVTRTVGSTSTVPGKSNIASKGVFTAVGAFNVGTLAKMDLINDTINIWKTGEFKDEIITLSNIRMEKPSDVSCTHRAYTYNITMDYKYTTLGKRIPSNGIILSYDVLDDLGAVVKKDQKTVIYPSEITEKSFTFELCIPFKYDGKQPGSVRPSAYLSNFIIKDNYEGISDTISDIFIASPFNTGYWGE